MNWQKLVLTLLVLLLALPAYAQDDPGTVTADQVNAIAKQMFCPECENVPLDTCGTQACIDWRAEIKRQLEAGATAEEIIQNFVNIYGEHVAATPRDPLLRSLALYTPVIIALLGVLLGGWLLVRWRRGAARNPETSPASPYEDSQPDSEYLARLESDLNL